MGLMRVVNLAHTSFAAIGGYVSVKLMDGVPFPLAIAVGVVAVVVLSIVVEKVIYVHLYKASELDQVLMTVGLLFFSVATLNLFFGPNTVSVRLPDVLARNAHILGRDIQMYRLFVIACGSVLLAALWFLFYRTSFGAMLRAAVDNRSMAQATGINVNLIFSLAFALGSGLAAFGGAIGFAVLPLEPMYPFKYLTLVLIVVTISGAADIKGAAVAAILVGIIDTAGRYLYPAYGAFFIYFVLLGITIWRNKGLVAGRAH
jgi:branched-chain amino acid transport system permease protein